MWIKHRGKLINLDNVVELETFDNRYSDEGKVYHVIEVFFCSPDSSATLHFPSAEERDKAFKIICEEINNSREWFTELA